MRVLDRNGVELKVGDPVCFASKEDGRIKAITNGFHSAEVIGEFPGGRCGSITHRIYVTQDGRCPDLDLIPPSSNQGEGR